MAADELGYYDRSAKKSVDDLQEDAITLAREFSKINEFDDFNIDKVVGDIINDIYIATIYGPDSGKPLREKVISVVSQTAILHLTMFEPNSKQGRKFELLKYTLSVISENLEEQGIMDVVERLSLQIVKNINDPWEHVFVFYIKWNIITTYGNES